LEYFKKIIKESIIVILITAVIGFCTGSFLSANEDILYYVPVILIILPALNDTIGDVSTIIVSRLTTHLFLGIIDPKIRISKRLTDDFFSLLIIIILCSITILVLGYIIAFFTGIPLANPFLIIFIILLSGMFLFTVLSIFLFVGAIYLFKKGHDPNNFLIPIATTLADFLTPISVIFLVIIFI